MILLHCVAYYELCCFSRTAVVANIISREKEVKTVFCIYSVKQQFSRSLTCCLVHMVPSLFIWLSMIKVENLLINMNTKFKLREYFVISRDLMLHSSVVRKIDMPLPLTDLCHLCSPQQ